MHPESIIILCIDGDDTSSSLEMIEGDFLAGEDDDEFLAFDALTLCEGPLISWVVQASIGLELDSFVKY